MIAVSRELEGGAGSGGGGMQLYGGRPAVGSGIRGETDGREEEEGER